MDVSALMRYGCTWVSTHFMLANEMPHDGLKQSGYSKEVKICRCMRWKTVPQCGML